MTDINIGFMIDPLLGKLAIQTIRTPHFSDALYGICNLIFPLGLELIFDFPLW